MVAPPLVSLRTATVAPEPVPAFSPMLYGVVLVQVTWMGEVWSTLAARTPWVPKSSVDALLMVQVAVMATWTANVEVVLAACDDPAQEVRKQAASAAVHPARNFTLHCMRQPPVRNPRIATNGRNLLINH